YLTEYVWMGSLGFSGVFTTVLWSKVILAVIGFLLFAIITFATAYWIRRSYLSHFAPVQLPKMILNKKQMMWVMVGISVLIGLFGSSIVQGLGWRGCSSSSIMPILIYLILILTWMYLFIYS